MKRTNGGSLSRNSFGGSGGVLIGILVATLTGCGGGGGGETGGINPISIVGGNAGMAVTKAEVAPTTVRYNQQTAVHWAVE